MDEVDGTGQPSQPGQPGQPGQPTDDALILAVAHRDPAALMTLHDRYARIAFGLAYRILGEAGAAEEAVQDAFMLVWCRATLFDPRVGQAGHGKVRAWILTIVHHRAIDIYRLRAGRNGIGLAQPLDGMEDDLTSPDVWDDVAQGLERDRVRAAVAALPAEQRETIALAYFEGLTHREIAERSGTPLGTVKGRLRLGLQKLYALLAEFDPREPAGQLTQHPSPPPGDTGSAVRQ